MFCGGYTCNGGSGIHFLGLVGSQGANWLALNNGTNPGNGQNNVTTPQPDDSGNAGGGENTYTGAPDIWFDESTLEYGVTDNAFVTNIHCGQELKGTWNTPAEKYGIWFDDGLATKSVVVWNIHSTLPLRRPHNEARTFNVGDTLGNLTDVDMSVAPTTGATLKWNGTAWVPSNA